MATFKSKAYDYREIAYTVICECIKKDKFGKPPVGFYHIIGIDFGFERPLFYRVTHNHVETTDKISHDIIDNIYYLQHTLEFDQATGKMVDNNHETKVTSLRPTSRTDVRNREKWRHFELTT